VAKKNGVAEFGTGRRLKFDLCENTADALRASARPEDQVHWFVMPGRGRDHPTINFAPSAVHRPRTAIDREA
jgi:hypothetical protein